jgi:acetyl-CoA C-acetyltransferase
MNRFCGSGQQAVNFAASAVAAGHYHCVVAGGVEMMSHYPTTGGMTLDGGNPGLRARYPIVPQGISAELIATLEGFSREKCDAFAAESQRRAAAAISRGRFDRSLIVVRNKDGSVALDREEHPRSGTTTDSLAKLKPAFVGLGQTRFDGYDSTFEEMCLSAYPQIDHLDYVHHGGNSSGVVDGAAAILITSPDYAKAHRMKPRARVVMAAAVGSEPVIMLTAPAAAARRCMERAGKAMPDVDLWEVNEAFAAVALKFLKDTGIDPERVNVNGGAIALGHPIGATGPTLLMTALDELELRDQSSAVVVMCTGGGMGTATLIERF